MAAVGGREEVGGVKGKEGAVVPGEMENLLESYFLNIFKGPPGAWRLTERHFLPHALGFAGFYYFSFVNRWGGDARPYIQSKDLLYLKCEENYKRRVLRKFYAEKYKRAQREAEKAALRAEKKKNAGSGDPADGAKKKKKKRRKKKKELEARDVYHNAIEEFRMVPPKYHLNYFRGTDWMKDGNDQEGFIEKCRAVEEQDGAWIDPFDEGDVIPWDKWLDQVDYEERITMMKELERVRFLCFLDIEKLMDGGV